MARSTCSSRAELEDANQPAMAPVRAAGLERVGGVGWGITGSSGDELLGWVEVGELFGAMVRAWVEELKVFRSR